MNADGPFSILVVDDEPAITRTLCSFLKLHGYAVDGESDPQVAFQRALEGDYHLVVTDLVMPGMCGLQLIRALREAGVLAEIIVITAYSTLDRAIEAHALGVTDYLLKPFENLAEVGEVVGSAATRHQRWRKALARTLDRGD